MAYKQWHTICNAIFSRRYQSLQSAWEECAKGKNCKGVIEENCSGNSFFACNEWEQGPPSDGFNGCFYMKPSEV